MSHYAKTYIKLIYNKWARIALVIFLKSSRPFLNLPLPFGGD
jgi:hypothetical protein